MRHLRLSPLLLLALAGTAQAAEIDQAELKAFRDTAERYSDRMQEFVADVRVIVDQAETADRSRTGDAYKGAIGRAEDAEGTLRRTTISKIESFLRKYPKSTYTADMEFRLADLYYEESELDFLARMEEYNRIGAQAAANPNIVLPEDPQKDYSKSIALYRDIIANHGTYEYLVNTYYMLGWCLGSASSQQFDQEAARDAYLAIVERFPKTEAANDANMKLGEYYFDKAESAQTTAENIPIAIKYYESVLKDGPSGRNYDEAIYKLGWSHFKLNHFDESLGYLVQLLDYSDKQFLETGRNSAMRPEAVQYLAIAYSDMGQRSGVSALEVAKKHLARLGERKWQHDVITRLAENLDQSSFFEDSIATYEYLQQKWPNDPKNPDYQYKIATIWAKVPPGGEEEKAQASKALAVLAERYNEGTPWAIANRGNPEAISNARAYIENSLGGVASQYLVNAQKSGNPDDYAFAAKKLGEFLDSFPYANNYDEYQWYEAYALFQSKQLPQAEKLYVTITKNDSSPYRDQARFQLVVTREALAEAKLGKADIRPPDAAVEKEITTPFGKKITVYRISDEQKALIAALDDVVDRELKDPDTAKLVADRRQKLMYLAGRIYEEHGQYDEARKRLGRVIHDYRTTPEGVNAAKLYVNTYVAEGDLDNVLASTKSFGDLDKTFGTIEEQASFNKCADYGSKNQYANAAACYDRFLVAFPQSEYLRDALFNAANNYDRAGKADRAIVLFEQYINKYPSDQRSKDLYVRLGETYSSILELDKAIGYFQALPKLDVNHVDAAVAQSNAAFLKIGVGDHAGAAASLEDYAKLFPNQPDAELLFWKAGEQWELVGEGRAQQFYADYLSRFPNGDPNKRIEALYRIATFKTKKGQSATATWSQLQEVYRANAGGALNQRARSLAAEGALKDLMAEFDRFKTYKFAKNEKKDVELVTKTKPEALKVLNQHSLDLIQNYQDFDTTTASLYIQGMAHFAYADMLFAVPMPPSLSDEEQGIYQDQLDQIRLPVEDRGKARLNAALEKAKAEKRWNEWVDKSLSALHDRYPTDFPSERSESKGTVNETAVPFSGAVSLPEEGQ